MNISQPGAAARRTAAFVSAAAGLLLAPAMQAAVLEEVIVTAQKRDQNLQDVGVSVTAMTGEAVEALGFTNSTDLAAQVPGLNIGTPVGEGNNPSIVLRGVGLNDFNDNNEGPVAVYKDDVYLGSMVGQTFQLFDMQRVEVLRGPQGTLYGRNATGGLVHYISNQPTEEFEVNSNLTLGSYDRLQLEGSISGPLSDGVRARLALAHNQHDPYVKNRIGPDTNEADSIAYRAMLAFDVGANASALLNLHGGESDVVAPAYQHQVTDPSGVDFWGYADNDGDPFRGDYDRNGSLRVETQGASLTFNYAGDIEFVSITAWEDVEKLHEEDSDVGPNPGLEPVFAADYEQLSQELRISADWQRGNWVAGLYYFDSEVEGDYQLDINYPGVVIDAILSSLGVPGFPAGLGPEIMDFLNYDVDFDQQTSSLAAFGQLEYTLSESWRLIAGLRYTTEERDYSYTNFDTDAGALVFDYSEGGADVINGNRTDIDQDNISGKLGLNWDAAENIMLFGNLSRGFKSGGFNAGFMDADMQFARDNFGITTQYDEEILDSFEVGVKSRLLGDKVRLNATLFYYDYKDYQALSFFGVSQFIVNSDAGVQGGELELVAQPLPGLELQLGASFLDTEVDEVRDLNTGNVLTDREMVLAPEFTLNGLVRYEWPIANGGAVSAQVDFNYQDDHFFDITNQPIAEEDGYVVWNARLAYVFPQQRWQVALWGKNLADEEYRVYSFDFTGPGGFNQNFFAPPRWFGLTLSYDY